MYTKHKVIIFFSAIAIFYIFNFIVDVHISESMIQNFITFLSIIFGFYMTSLSVLYNSKYIKKLYDEIDSNRRTQRKIHTLKAYFSNSAYWSLGSIAYIMACSLFISANDSVLQFNRFVEALMIAIIFLNFIFMILLFKVLLNGLVHESMSESKN